MPINVIIADDHEVIINGLITMLDAAKQSFQFQKANSLEQLNKKLNRSVDLLILDVNIGAVNSINSIPSLLKSFPELKIIVFTSYQSPALRREAIAAGAKAFLTKDVGEKKLIETVLKVLNRPHLNLTSRKHLPLQESKIQDNFLTQGLLSNRQIEILKLVANGHTSQQICEKLCISKHTVQWHRKNILSKLNLKTSGEMIRFAFDKGLV